MTRAAAVERRFSPVPVFVNIALVGLLVFLTRDPAIVVAVGVTTLAVGAITGASAAWNRGARNVVEFLQAWLPGLVGLVLGAAGLALIMSNPMDGPMRSAGVALFIFQVALVASLAMDAGGVRRSP